MLYANVMDFGAKGDGVTDDTVSIQTAVFACSTVMFPAGTFLISSIRLQSNQRLILDPACTLLKKPQPLSNAIMLYLPGLTNVSIEGGTIDGNLANNPFGQCHGIGFAGSSHIRIKNVTIKNMPGSPNQTGNYGDGIYVGSGPGGAPVQDIVIEDCFIDRCDRHCVFFVSVDGAKVVNCTFSNCVGNEPGTCVNFEPNVAAEVIRNVLISGCEMSNSNGGITANNHYSPTIDSDFRNIRIDNCSFFGHRQWGLHAAVWGPGGVISNCQFHDNAADGLYVGGCQMGLAVVGCTFYRNAVGARFITSQFFDVEACTFALNQQHGCVLTTSDTSNSPHYATIANSQFWNNGTSGKYDGLWVWPDNVAINAQFSVANCWFGNHQYWGAPTQNWGINFAVSSTPLIACGAQYIGNRFLGNLKGEVHDNGTNFHLQAEPGKTRPSWLIGARLNQGQPETGYGYLPSCQGKPTGIPAGFVNPSGTAPNNGVPFVIDEISGKMWVFTNGSWK